MQSFVTTAPGEGTKLVKGPSYVGNFCGLRECGKVQTRIIKTSSAVFWKAPFLLYKKRFYVPKCSNDMGAGKIREKVLKMKMLKFHKGILFRKLNVISRVGKAFPSHQEKSTQIKNYRRK